MTHSIFTRIIFKSCITCHTSNSSIHTKLRSLFLSLLFLLIRTHSPCFCVSFIYGISISFIYSPVRSLLSPCHLLGSSLLSPPQLLLNTDQPSCLYLHLLTRPPLLSLSLPHRRTSAHIHPFLHFFVSREQGGRPVIRISFLCSFARFFSTPPSVRRLSGAFTCHC